jgi:hypothetical protein
MGRIVVQDDAGQCEMKETLVSKVYLSRFWSRRNRAEVVTVESLQPSAVAWKACDLRLEQELRCVIDLAVCIKNQEVDGEDADDPPDLCAAKEYYGLGVLQEVLIHP